MNNLRASLPATNDRIFVKGHDERTQRVFVRCEISRETCQPFIQPGGVAFRFRKRLRLLERIPFDQEALRTGDCLLRLQWSNKTSHLPFKKYDLLKSLSGMSKSIDDLIVGSESEYRHGDTYVKNVSPAEKACAQSRIDKESDDTDTDDLLVEQDAFADFQQRCRPDVLSDREWVCPAAEPFVRSEWGIIPLHGMPIMSQPSPAPLAGADEYGIVRFRERIPFADIPNLKKKTQAKNEARLRKKKSEKERLCAERKALYKRWAPLLRKDYDSETHEKPIHDPRCTRCGGEFFKKNLDCYDCGWNMSHFVHERESIDEEIAHDPRNENSEQINHILTEHNLTKGRTRAWIRKEEFLIAWVLNSRSAVNDLCTEDGRDRARSALRVLVDGELPKKVAAETGESQRAIESRCERLLAALRTWLATGAEPPVIEPAHVILLHKCFPNSEHIDDVLDRHLRAHYRTPNGWSRKAA